MKFNGSILFVAAMLCASLGCRGTSTPVEDDVQSEEPAANADAQEGEQEEDDAAFPNPPVAENGFRARIAPSASDVKRFTTDLGEEGALRATITTNKGELECTLFEEESPITVANFVGLARGLKAWTMPVVDQSADPPVQYGDPMTDTPLYNGVLCHRVIPNFMIQCGDPSGTGMGGPGYQIPDEFGAGLKHDRPGLLSMANAGPGTGGSQFFITEVPTPHLDNRHTIFGECEQIELIKEIARVERGPMDRPVLDVVIETIEIYRK